MLFIFSTPVLIRHLWQLKTAVFLHWCQICALLLCLPTFPRYLGRCDINRNDPIYVISPKEANIFAKHFANVN